MGKSSGGVRGSGGLNKSTPQTIIDTEIHIRGERVENAHIFTADGKLIRTAKGDARSVNIGNAPADSIVTHNHPLTKGERGMLISLSDQDLQYAVDHNLREIRAITTTHSFSMKRKGKNWGEKAQREDIKKTYKRIERES